LWRVNGLNALDIATITHTSITPAGAAQRSAPYLSNAQVANGPLGRSLGRNELSNHPGESSALSRGTSLAACKRATDALCSFRRSQPPAAAAAYLGDKAAPLSAELDGDFHVAASFVFLLRLPPEPRHCTLPGINANIEQIF